MITIDFRSCCVEHSCSSSAKAGSTHRIRNNSPRLVTICLALAALLAGAPATGGLPAFPGAEGAGALAMGGRGGAVCKVTNLNDAGPGSLRDCAARQGPRTVIFEVGGTIELKSRIEIRNPYITIAGQTAPGGGIQIKAAKDATWKPDISITTHNVVIRYLRLRKGYTGHKQDNLSISGGHTVIADHLSMFWGENQNLGIRETDLNGAPYNVTVQNSIMTEMTDGRVNILVTHNGNPGMTNIDLHNNYIANSSHRNPRMLVESGRAINNIIYNWGSWASRTQGPMHFDWIANLWRPGPATSGSRTSPEIMANSNTGTFQGAPTLHIAGNRGILSGMSPDADNWPYTCRYADDLGSVGAGQNAEAVECPIPLSWQREEPLPPAGVPITVRHVDGLEDHLLPIVGASRRLDCDGTWVPNRDAADQRAITEYRNRQGILTNSGEGEEIYGGHPTLAAGVACQDSSGDGIPDVWAIGNGLNPLDPTLGNTIHETGYTYLELYLNGTQLGAAPPSRMPIVVR